MTLIDCVNRFVSAQNQDYFIRGCPETSLKGRVDQSYRKFVLLCLINDYCLLGCSLARRVFSVGDDVHINGGRFAQEAVHGREVEKRWKPLTAERPKIT